MSRWAHAAGVVAAGLALASCSGTSGSVDPKYGVSASARVVAPGQPVPKGGGYHRVGKPYTIGGRTYVPEADPNYSAVGIASWYGDAFHGRYTANGEIFDMNSLTAAHPTLPLPSYVRVTNLRNNRSVVVRVNDRGPFVGNRVIDLSQKTARVLDTHGHGVVKVKVEYIGQAPLNGSDDRKLMATLRDGAPAAVKPVMVASNDTLSATFFDVRPLTESAPGHPRRAGDGARVMADAAAPAPRRPTTELAASAHAQTPAQQVARRTIDAPPMSAEPSFSPVSAYAPVRHNAHTGLMTGRGLY